MVVNSGVKQSKIESKPVNGMYHKNTNVGIGLLMQDGVWADWFVCAEAEHHEGLACRLLFNFAKGRMISPQRLKSFHDDVYKGLVRSTFAPRKDMMDKNEPVGNFQFHESERGLKNVRVACKLAEPANSVVRRKFDTGLQKCGYWVPAVAWENAMLRLSLEAVLSPGAPMPGRNTTIPLCEFPTGSMFMAYRYGVWSSSTGQ